MRRALMVVGLLWALTAAPVGASPSVSDTPGTVVIAEAVAEGLDFPAAFTFAPDGRIFYGERLTGEIRIIDPDLGTNTLFATIPGLSSDGEQGLLGLALHPRYPTQPFVYAFATGDLQGDARDQIIMIRDVGGVGTSPRAIFTQDTSDKWSHHGGRILFGPDRMLYAVTGDAEDPANAQVLETNSGKILRMTMRGRVPPDNPFPGSLVFAYGVRNSFGMAFDPVTRVLWESENGPSCNDELNIILPGENHGWGPSQTCDSPPDPPGNTNQDGPDPVLPEAFYTPTIAPVGAVFCHQCGLAAAEGTLFLAAYNTWAIRSMVLTEDRMGISSELVMYTHQEPVISMERGPDGLLYLSDFDAIYRLVEG